MSNLRHDFSQQAVLDLVERNPSLHLNNKKRMSVKAIHRKNSNLKEVEREFFGYSHTRNKSQNCFSKKSLGRGGH